MPEPKHYEYTVSIPAAVVAIIIFIVLFVIHTYLLVRKRTWFCIPFVIGAIFEWLGYIGHAMGHNDPDSNGTFIFQYLLILLAPILFAASVYMFLGRIVLSTGKAHLSIIRPTWLTKIFVGGDILCFLVQALGGSILAGAKTASALTNGKNIILTGLVLQIIIFGFFIVVGLIFNMRMRKEGAKNQMVVQKRLNMLFAVSIVITVRNIYRVIEYIQGRTGYLQSHEWAQYIFDALLMAIVLVIAVFWHVGNMMQESSVTETNGLPLHHQPYNAGEQVEQPRGGYARFSSNGN